MTSRMKKESSAKKKIRSRDFKSRLREDADQLPITVCGIHSHRLFTVGNGGALGTEH